MPALIIFCLLLVVPSSASRADSPPRTWTPEVTQTEFEALYEKLREPHYDIYANRSRVAYDALFKKMRAGIDRPMSLSEIQQRFQRFVAYGNVAHAKIDPPIAEWEGFRNGGGKVFPAYFRVIDGRVYIDDVRGDVSLSVGDQVLAINGMPALNWLAQIRAHLSADSDYLAYTMMENLLPLLVWQEFGEVDTFDMEIMRRGEGPFRITVPAMSQSDSQNNDADQPDRFALDWNAREARMITDSIAYLRPGPFYDNRPTSEHPWDPSAFHAFVDTAFETFIEADAKRVIIDLRNNPGGSNEFSDHLIAWFATEPFRFSEKFEIKVSEAAIASNLERLRAQRADADVLSAALAAAYESSSLGQIIDFPIKLIAPRKAQRFQNKVYILINRHSYSNAVSVAAIGQDYGFANILGEPTADLANTYGGMEHFTLPSTGIRVGFPKARILRPSRDLDADIVVPDILIDAPLAPSTDIMLDRAIDAIADMESK